MPATQDGIVSVAGRGAPAEVAAGALEQQARSCRETMRFRPPRSPYTSGNRCSPRTGPPRSAHAVPCAEPSPCRTGGLFRLNCGDPPAQIKYRRPANICLEIRRTLVQQQNSLLELEDSASPYPFLKWAGGKAQLLGQYERFFPPKCRTYYEPFVGGAAVFFYLRQLPSFAQKYYISDANPELVLTYQVVRDQPEELLSYLHEYDKFHQKFGREFYYTMRSWDRSNRFHTRKKVKRAARFIYLNKTCYNGLWRVNSNGEFNVPMGNYKNPNIHDAARIRTASRVLQGVTIARADFQVAVDSAAAGDFVYFDPPYVPLNSTSNFTGYDADGFGLHDQQRLADLFLELHRRDCKVMLSNSDTPEVREMYAGLNIDSLRISEVYARRQINSAADKRGEITELVVTNY